MKLSNLFAFVALCSLLCQVADSTGQEANAVWDGSTGFWSDASKWSSPAFPNNGNGGLNYNVDIPNGRVTMDSDITIEQFEFNGIELNFGNFRLTVNQDAEWTNGSLQGGGITDFFGFVEYGGSSKRLNGNTINNHADADWCDGDFYSGQGAVFNNLATAKLCKNVNANFLFNLGGQVSEFNNFGTFENNGLTRFTARFSNRGIVDVQSGELVLDGGGMSDGTFLVAPLASLKFRGGHGGHQLMAPTITGGGDVEFTNLTTSIVGGTYDLGGATFVSGGTVNFDLPFFETENLTISGGILRGAPQGGFVGTNLTFTGGTLERPGSTVVLGNMILEGGVKRIRDEHILANAVTATWTQGDIYLGSSAIFQNRAGAILEASSDADFLYNLGGSMAIFYNEGEFSKTAGDGVTRFTSFFENRGTVNVDRGTLELDGPVENRGEINVAAGTTLELASGGSMHFAGARLAGEGDLDFSGGTHELHFLADDFALQGQVHVSGGSTELVVKTPVVVSQLSFDSGTRNGSADIDVVQVFQWNGGLFNGNATTHSHGTLMVDGTTVRLQNDHLFRNHGVGLWSSGSFFTGSGAGFINMPGAVFEIIHDAEFLYNLGGNASVFENQGTLSKSGGAGDTVFSSDFYNSGTLKFDSGNVRFDRGLVQTGGNTSFSGGTAEAAFNHCLEFLGGELSGEVVISGNVDLLGALARPGKNSQGSRIDSINIDGDVNIGNESIIEIEIQSVVGGSGISWDVVKIFGDVNLAPVTGSHETTIKLVSLDENGNRGPVPDFDGGSSYQFPVVFANSIMGFDPANITIDTTEFDNPLMASFSVMLDLTGPMSQLIVNYAGILLGDVNQDGSVNLLDVDPFVTAVGNGTFIDEADMNRDGSVNLLDVALFIQALTN